MNSLEISPWGQIQRLGMSNWADDSPRSPADVMSRSQSGQASAFQRNLPTLSDIVDIDRGHCLLYTARGA